MVSLRVIGLDKVIRDVKSRGDEKKLLKFQHDLALWIKLEAKRLCPVDTGFMKETIYMRRLAGYNYEVGVDAPYAIWNEFGPMPGRVPVGKVKNPVFYKGGYRPFLRPAAWRGTRKIPQIFGKIYRINIS